MRLTEAGLHWCYGCRADSETLAVVREANTVAAKLNADRIDAAIYNLTVLKEALNQ